MNLDRVGRRAHLPVAHHHSPVRTCCSLLLGFATVGVVWGEHAAHVWLDLQERIIKSKAVVPTKFSWVFNKEIPVIQV